MRIFLRYDAVRHVSQNFNSVTYTIAICMKPTITLLVKNKILPVKEECNYSQQLLLIITS